MINGAGLVGKVLDVTSGDAVVTLLTDQSFATGVIAGDGRDQGSVTPAVGAPGDLLFEPVDTGARVRENDLVYTAGTTDSRLQSRYPAGILIGKVDADRPRRRRPRPAHPRRARRRPAAPGHGPGPDRARRRPGPGRQVTITPASVIRLALLGLLGGIMQLTAVSQVTDLRCARRPHAAAGRVRRVPRRLDPRRDLRLQPRPVRGHQPLPDARRQLARVHRRRLRRRARSASCATPRTASRRWRSARPRRRSPRSCFTLLQFLLGVQAPVSLLLLREILMTIVLNTLLALPVYALMRRALLPFLPDDPRRRRRRAYTTGGLSPISRACRCRSASKNASGRSRPSWRGASPCSAAIAFVLFGIVFFRLWYLQVLTGEEARLQASENRVRKERIEAPRGDIVDRNNVKLVRDQAGRGRADGALQLPAERARPGRRVPQGARRRRARRGWRPRRSTTRSGASCATTAASHQARASASSAAAAGRRDTAARSPVPRRPREPELAELYRRIGRGPRTSARRRSTSA